MPANPPPHEHLSNVTVRSLLIIFVGSILFPFFVVAHYLPGLSEPDWEPISDALTSASCYLLMLALLAVVAQSNLVRRQHLIPAIPPADEMWRYILLGVPMVAAAIASIFILYVPLSYVSPDFVTSWLIEEQSHFIWPRTDLKALIGTTGNLIALALLAPVAEEILFRGFMLNRFRRKLGTVAAVVLSSLIFAVLHADLLGAFLFGVIVSAIYLQTGSLVGPILVHISNNTIVSVLALGDAVLYPDYTLTLEDFQAYWWLAIVAGAIGFPWLWVFWRKHISFFKRRAA